MSQRPRDVAEREPSDGATERTASPSDVRGDRANGAVAAQGSSIFCAAIGHGRRLSPDAISYNSAISACAKAEAERVVLPVTGRVSALEGITGTPKRAR